MRFEVTWSSGKVQVVEPEGVESLEEFERFYFAVDDPRSYGVKVKVLKEGGEDDAHEAADQEGTGAGETGPAAPEAGDREEV